MLSDCDRGFYFRLRSVHDIQENVWRFNPVVCLLFYFYYTYDWFGSWLYVAKYIVFAWRLNCILIQFSVSFLSV